MDQGTTWFEAKWWSWAVVSGEQGEGQNPRTGNPGFH